jgi:hypothetical protein
LPRIRLRLHRGEICSVDDHVHNVRLAPSLHGHRIIQQHCDDLFCERHSAGAQVGIPGSHTRPAPSGNRSGSMDAWTRGGQLLRGRLRPGEACTFKLSHFYRLRPMQLHRISDIRRASRVRTGRRRHHSINEDFDIYMSTGERGCVILFRSTHQSHWKHNPSTKNCTLCEPH